MMPLVRRCRRLVRLTHYFNAGIGVMNINGTTSEQFKLTRLELEEIIEACHTQRRVLLENVRR